MSSPIEDLYPTDAAYFSQHVKVMLGGTVIGRVQEVSFRVDMNMNEFYELGDKRPRYQGGNISYTGTLSGFYLDSTRIRMAIGHKKSVIDGEPFKGTFDKLSKDVFDGTETKSAGAFGSGEWFKGFEFDLVIVLQLDDLTEINVTLKRCLLATYTFTSPINRQVNERMDFVFHDYSVGPASSAAT